MTKLKFEKVNIIKIEESDFNDFVEHIYGQEFCFTADQLSAEDVAHSFGVLSKEELDDYDQSNLNDFKNGEHKENLSHVIVQDLVNKEHLPSNIEIFIITE